MSEPVLYWGVDEHGIPYPLGSVEEWWTFPNEYPERIRVAWDEWKTAKGVLIEVSTKFFGTDMGREFPKGRCMFETAFFVNGQLFNSWRVETRAEAEQRHALARDKAKAQYPPKKEQ